MAGGMLLLETLNLKGLNISYCYNEYHIRLDKPLSEQIWELNEDILQLQIEDKYIIDLGYYPSHSLKGRFKIVVIKDYDWSSPIWIKTCKNPDFLVKHVQEAVDVVKDLII
jgi:hypothetical protein